MSKFAVAWFWRWLSDCRAAWHPPDDTCNFDGLAGSATQPTRVLLRLQHPAPVGACHQPQNTDDRCCRLVFALVNPIAASIAAICQGSHHCPVLPLLQYSGLPVVLQA